MRRTDNYASNQIRLLLNELAGSSHADKKKAIATFQTYVETYHPEVADENVDYLFTGCINGKLGTGLLYWGGVGSDSRNSGQLKRICSHVVRLIRWLVTHESESERGNFYYTRFVQLQLSDLKMLNIPKHVTSKKKKKKRADEEDENEDIFILLAILMNEHRTPQGKISRLELDDLLMFDEEAHFHFTEWTNSGAIEQIPNYRGGKRREEVIDRPHTWEEVVFKCVPLQEGEEDMNELDVEPEVIPPIPDPLGISSVDLRSIQAFYASGRLMKSQTGQLARRATNAVMPIGGANPSGMRKTSFRSSTTFIPYKHEDDNSDDSDEDSEGEDGAEESVRPSFNTAVTAGEEEGGTEGASQQQGSGGSGRMKALGSTTSISGSGREKKQLASVVPSDKNFSTVLFLTLVHGSASFNQLKAGQDHLQQHLMLQSSRRENLVRLHFGLFVQCAEGLEFLKAYRKGVLKGNELRQRRGSNLRKSVVAGEDLKNRRQSGLVTGAPAAGGVASSDKGLERLKRSQATLDAAKVEAQRTLAPILERMKQSRRIKSAEKVLKRMTAILEYPVRMRTALDRGDLSEVVAIYQRVQAVPTSSSSLRILHKIKEAAGLVVTDLKKQCFTALMSPNANYATLLRYGKIWLDLEGEVSYYELLRQSMIRQVLHFLERIKDIRDKFCTDCADANDRGLEQNLLKRSPFLSGGAGNHGERESISSLIRRHADQASSRKRQSARAATSSHDLSEFGMRGRTSSESVVGNQWQEDDDVNFQENRDEFAVDGESSDEDWLDEDEDLDDPFLDGDIDDLDFLDDIGGPGQGGSAPSSTKRKSLTFSDDVTGGSEKTVSGDDMGGRAMRRGSANDVNHSVLLCALVRQGCVEALVDLLAKWFPCMFRLVSALSTMSINSGSASANTPAPLLKSTKPTAAQSALSGSGGGAGGTPAGKGTAAGGAGGYTNLNRGAISPARILGAALKIYGDYLKQVISGVDMSFSILNLPSELNAAFNEVDSFISSAHFPVSTVTPLVITLTNPTKVENKTFDAVASSILVNPLREPFHRDALQEVYDLYNAMEFIMKKEAAALQSATGQGGAGGGAGSNFHNTRVPFGAPSAKNYLNFLSPASPYYDSMNTLQALSKEGEMALAQKIMDKLLDLSTQLCTYDPDRLLAIDYSAASSVGGAMGRVASAGSSYYDAQSTTSGKARRRGSVMETDPGATLAEKLAGVGMEQNVTELGELIMRCLRSVRTKVKREEWVAVVVQEGVQRVFSSFVEALRRESMKVADGNYSQRSRDSILNGSAGVPTLGGAKRGRKSASNMRSSIGNGLVLETLEEELKFGEADQNRARLQLDLLRACIRLRCNCIPYIGNEIKKVFALPEEQDAAAAAHAAASKLPFPAVDAKNKAAPGTAAAAGGILSRTKSSLMTKLFSAEKETESQVAASALTGMESPARIGGKEKKKMTLHYILLQFVKIISIDLFEQNLHEVATIEDQAATTYVNLKAKDIRTTIFAGYAYLVHQETCNTWAPLPSNGAVRMPTHLARVLLTLGNEKRLLAEALGDLKVLRGDTTPEVEDEVVAPATAPPGAISNPSSAPNTNRSLFGGVEDSASEDEDTTEDHGKAAAKKAFCESLLYRDHLYKQLCVGLLQVYQDLIERLRNNTFTDRSDAGKAAASSRRQPSTRRNNRVAGDMFTTAVEEDEEDSEEETDSENEGTSAQAAGGLSKVPFSLGQAIEEHKYIKELLMPLLNHDITIAYIESAVPTVDRAQQQSQENAVHRFIGKMFPSAAQLTNSGKMFAVMINDVNR